MKQYKTSEKMWDFFYEKIVPSVVLLLVELIIFILRGVFAKILYGIIMLPMNLPEFTFLQLMIMANLLNFIVRTPNFFKNDHGDES